MKWIIVIVLGLAGAFLLIKFLPVEERAENSAELRVERRPLPGPVHELPIHPGPVLTEPEPSSPPPPVVHDPPRTEAHAAPVANFVKYGVLALGIILLVFGRKDDTIKLCATTIIVAGVGAILGTPLVLK